MSAPGVASTSAGTRPPPVTVGVDFAIGGFSAVASGSVPFLDFGI
jgi:hypothetical protein